MSDDNLVVNLDFTGVTAVSKPVYTLMDEGIQVVVLEGIQVKPAKSGTGNMVAHCDYTVSGGDYDGRKLKNWQVVGASGGLTDEQKGYLLHWIECHTGETFDSKVSLNLGDLVGTSAQVMIVQRDRNDGKKDAEGEVMKQNEIHYFINPLEG
jgi:hypothetical protein